MDGHRRSSDASHSLTASSGSQTSTCQRRSCAELNARPTGAVTPVVRSRSERTDYRPANWATRWRSDALTDCHSIGSSMVGIGSASASSK